MNSKKCCSISAKGCTSLVPRPYFYIKVTGAKNIFCSRNFNIKIGPGDEAKGCTYTCLLVFLSIYTQKPVYRYCKNGNLNASMTALTCSLMSSACCKKKKGGVIKHQCMQYVCSSGFTGLSIYIEYTVALDILHSSYGR